MGVPVDSNVTEEYRTDALSLSRDETIAYLFLFCADKIIFGKLLEDIENAFTQGDDNFPTDLTHAYKLLTNWKQYVPPRGRRSDTGDISFANIGANGVGITKQMSFTNIGGDNSKIQCYNLQQMGHYANDCTNNRVERSPRTSGGVNNNNNEVQLIMDTIIEDDDSDYSDFSFHIDNKSHGGLSRTWILLDN